MEAASLGRYRPMFFLTSTPTFDYFLANVERLVLGWLAGLYRSRILQVNARLKALGAKKKKALDEIYKICMLLHRSDLSMSAKCCRIFRRFHYWKC